MSLMMSLPVSQKGARFMAYEHDDEAETTDIGVGSASESESASEMSGAESSYAKSKRCRFGRTPLETIPATPVASMGAPGDASPPGLSRAALRQARDAVKVALPAPTLEVSPPATAEQPSIPSLVNNRNCRFGSTALTTVPATPPKAGVWKAMAKALGSPPGLSRAEMRKARDGIKGTPLPPTSWGSCAKSTDAAPETLLLGTSQSGASSTPMAVRTAKRRAAREAMVLAAREGAALIKAEAEALKRRNIEANRDLICAESGITHSSSDSSEPTTDGFVGHSSEDSAAESSSHECLPCSSSEEGSSAGSSLPEGWNCRFGSSALQTVPATPAGKEAANMRSPPGLSRASLRQARDAVKAQAPTWGQPAGAATPPQLRTQKRQAMRDAMLARIRRGEATEMFSTPAISTSKCLTAAEPR